MKRKLFLCLFILLVTTAGYKISGLDISNFCDASAPGLEIQVGSRSGTPLLLDFAVKDPEGVLELLRIESEPGSAVFSAPEREEFTFRFTPFSQPGVYTLVLKAETKTGSCSRELEVGFAEFVWGRDNFRFSNIRSPHGSVRPYSDVLFAWAEQRFEALELEEKPLLLEYAYRLFGGSIGRCYAFSGSKSLFIQNPELLPSYYGSVYDIRESNSSVQRKMNMLQNDIMFDQFITRGYDIESEQKVENLRSQVSTIIKRISEGNCAVFGYLAPRRHHSMLAYGYIRDPLHDQCTFIVANNWGEEHEENVLSEAAVQIRVYLEEEREGPRVLWVDSPYRVYEYAEHLFFVEIEKEYDHPPEAFEAFVRSRRDLLREKHQTLIVVEQAKNALLVDASGTKAGRINGRTTEDLEHVDYHRVENVHLFRLPAELSLELRVTALKNDDDIEEPPPKVFVLALSGTEEDPEISYCALYKDLSEEEFTLYISPDFVSLNIPEMEEDSEQVDKSEGAEPNQELAD